MKYLKLFEAFKSEKLSKLWKFYKNDDNFKYYLQQYCDEFDMRLSEITDDCFELLDVSECLDRISNHKKNYEDYYEEEQEGKIYWFNENRGLCLITNLELDKSNVLDKCYAIPKWDWSAYYSFFEKSTVIKRSFDYVIVLYKKSNKLFDVRNKRKNNKPIKMDNEQLRRMNINRYINILSDRIDIKPEDKSLLSNFKPVIDKYLSLTEPILVLSNNDYLNISDYIKPYIDIFQENYEDVEYLISRIKERFKKLYSIKKRKFPERNLVLDTLTLNNLQEDVINILYDINDMLITNFKNYKFETIDDLYIFNRTLLTLKIVDNYYISSDLLEYLYESGQNPSEKCRRIANYFSSRNKDDNKLMIGQLKRYKVLVERTFKNNI